jgi:cell wall-associated NlpC family hydrolase
VTKPVPTKADRTASILLSFLRAQVGKPYVWGGNGPNVWDCSGLTKAAYARLGIYLPRTSEEQSLVGERVSLSHLEVGDLLFWGSPGFAFHVAIYVGHGKYIAAQNPHSGVMQLSLSYYHPSFARRVL